MPEGAGSGRPRVLELGAHPGLALCGKWLVGLGAHVTRLDVPGPGEDASADRYLNHGKERLTRDLDTREGLAGVRELVDRADVFITSLEATRLAELGLDFGTLSARRALIVGRVTALGDTGEYASLPGGELQALALSGLLNIVGEPDRPPLPLALATNQADYSAGLTLLTGIVFALWASDSEPGPREIVASSVRAAAYLDWKSQIYLEAEGRTLVRGSDRGPIVVRCADGFLGFYYRPADWEAVKRIVGGGELDDPRFVTQADRDAHRDALRRALERGLAARTRAEVYAAAQAARIPVGSVLSIPELLDDDQYAARGLWEEIDVPGFGPARAPAAPWTVDGERPTVANEVRDDA